ncbi:bifunctional UDP-N-acetylglucosamine diphosphorylase/glucosamine-1-phosphate N-acetyltransferase GlmU [Telmatospirillum siberiense]|uniref:Bifunctional protein GlmU n=1 Tax=Telmatospirillum siberiense TaxID=382514 RepID=A0A2N3PXC9_9PROT|nr:bifunctional UDP-N-acetylglucosamine diphosphorylase/glucosamine-1-phosphate N-acetyltransferase GlmU [Telmatospirillum siberiense]PKU25059.1 bifunctional N-acetylglucosamine-1-phosphate uridyltransferase/glucosamine-1-phosphate acetyltransferase [Telmatospirillum siberiense]
MPQENIAVIVLAAGMGTRMKSSLPKVMHRLADRPMINHLLDTVQALAPERVVTVIGPGMERVAAAVAPHPTVVQVDRLGTGHAVAQARAALANFTGTVLIVYGDTPLLGAASLSAMLDLRRSGTVPPAVVVLGFRPRDPGHYGRLLVGPAGLEAIVEYKDATPEQRTVDLCNSGVMAVEGTRLFGWIDRLSNDNAKGEYYLTDIVGLARADGLPCGFVEGDEEELLGVNSRVELAAAEAIAQTRLRHAAMEGGATLTDPASVHFAWDTRLGQDVVIGPNVVFGPGVSVGDRVEIRAFCHLEGARVAADCVIGPFARLRPGARIDEKAHIGNFVEIKNAAVEPGAKVNHLTYVGDARIGAGANIGAGTITCNYDGFDKSFTDIGAGAFIGSNSSLVAPVKIGDGAVVGAGSVITREVAAGALAVARGTQVEMSGWADRFRTRKAADKQKE